MALADELILAVGRGAGLTPDQAASAVSSMLRFFAAHLPSPLFGELQTRLNDTLMQSPATGRPAPGAGARTGSNE